MQSLKGTAKVDFGVLFTLQYVLHVGNRSHVDLFVRLLVSAPIT